MICIDTYSSIVGSHYTTIRNWQHAAQIDFGGSRIFVPEVVGRMEEVVTQVQHRRLDLILITQIGQMELV